MPIPKTELYLSSVLGRTVITQQGHEIGTLHDLAMVPGEHFPEVSHVLVKGADHILYVPWQRITLFNRFVISVTGSLQTIPGYHNQYHNGEILLRRDILDKQIVDVNGAKVVRVNDLKLGSYKEKLCVYFVDVGFRGLLRRMGYERLGEKIASLFHRQFPNYHISWEYVQLLESNLFQLTLNVARDQLKEIHPADLAQIISSIPTGNVEAMLHSLDTETAGEAIHELEPELRSRIISQLESEHASKILEEMDPDEAADVLGELPEEKAQELLGLMGEKEADEIQELLEHEENTAGGLMNSQFLAITLDLTAEEALQFVRAQASEVDNVYYLYVLDKNEQPRGVASLKDLLTHPQQARLSEFMSSGVKSVHVDSTPYDVVEILAKYNFIAVPVLDGEEKMVGIITVDDILEQFIPAALRRKIHSPAR
jgi:magnesium transporter